MGENATGASLDSGDSLFSALLANGESVFLTNNLFEFGSDLSIYEAVFVVLGIYPDNHVIAATDDEGPALETYLSDGGKLFIESADGFNYDPENGGYNIRPWFDLFDASDGQGDVGGVTGLNSLSDFAFNYSGTNSFMDELSPGSSTTLWQKDANSDISGVWYDGFGSGIAIGVVPSFGGFDNSSSSFKSATPAKDTRYTADKTAVRNLRQPARPFVKKSGHKPELKGLRSGSSYFDTDGSLKILADNKTDLMAAYLDLLGFGTAPRAALSANLVTDTLVTGSTGSYSLTITNSGNNTSELTFSLTESPAVDWLDENPLSGTVSGGSSTTITLDFDATNLSTGSYTTDLQITTNDPLNTVRVIPVTLNVDNPTGIDSDRQPTRFSLEQNYPNPFNPSTTIEYQLPQASLVNLTIYNTLGQAVTTLISRQQEAGYHRLQWNGLSNEGQPVVSGIYIYRLSAVANSGEPAFEALRKMILLK